MLQRLKITYTLLLVGTFNLHSAVMEDFDTQGARLLGATARWTGLDGTTTTYPVSDSKAIIISSLIVACVVAITWWATRNTNHSTPSTSPPAQAVGGSSSTSDGGLSSTSGTLRTNAHPPTSETGDKTPTAGIAAARATAVEAAAGATAGTGQAKANAQKLITPNVSGFTPSGIQNLNTSTSTGRTSVSGGSGGGTATQNQRPAQPSPNTHNALAELLPNERKLLAELSHKAYKALTDCFSACQTPEDKQATDPYLKSLQRYLNTVTRLSLDEQSKLATNIRESLQKAPLPPSTAATEKLYTAIQYLEDRQHLQEHLLKEKKTVRAS